MKLVKSTPEERELPRGVLGGAEVSQATAGATNIYMALVRVPAGSRGRPHYHDACESALFMIRGSVEIRFGDQLEESLKTAESVAGGWSYILSGLKTYLETGEPLAG